MARPLQGRYGFTHSIITWEYRVPRECRCLPYAEQGANIRQYAVFFDDDEGGEADLDAWVVTERTTAKPTAPFTTRMKRIMHLLRLTRSSLRFLMLTPTMYQPLTCHSTTVQRQFFQPLYWKWCAFHFLKMSIASRRSLDRRVTGTAASTRVETRVVAMEE